MPSSGNKHIAESLEPEDSADSDKIVPVCIVELVEAVGFSGIGGDTDSAPYARSGFSDQLPTPANSAEFLGVGGQDGI